MTLEQRLQYFSKIFKRSNDLQETVAKAFGKSARDAQGNVIAVEGLHDAHQPFVEREPYTTDALQKNIEYSVEALIPPPATPAVAAITFDLAGTTFVLPRASDFDAQVPGGYPGDNPNPYAWSCGMTFYTDSANPQSGDKVYSYGSNWQVATTEASVVSGLSMSAKLSPDVPGIYLKYVALLPTDTPGTWSVSLIGESTTATTENADPELGDIATVDLGEGDYATYEIVIKSVINDSVVNDSVVSDEESAVTPVDNVVFADVKRFCNGDDSGLSTWFKKEVSSQLPTVTFSCTHGSVVATVDGKEIGSGAHVGYGKSVVFTITADEGYQYTGTNPETVVVSGDVTKAYECTLIPVVVSPAVISIVNETEYNVPRSFNFDELAPTPLPEGWTHAYAWYGGDYIYYTSSSSPSTTDHLWDYDEGWIDVTSEYSIAITSVAIGPCISGYLLSEGDYWYDALTPSTDSPKEGFEGEWTDGYGDRFYTVSATPSVDDIIYGNQETPQPAGVVAAYSNISE